MNKSPEENGLDLFVQAHRRSPGVFIKILKLLKVKRSFIRCGTEVEQLCDAMEYSWGTSLHDGDMKEFLKIKTPQWRRG